MRLIGIIMRFLFWFIIALCCQTAFATSPHKSNEAFNNAVRSYSSDAGIHSLLFKGNEQMKYPLHYQNDPYYITAEYSPGNIWFNKTYYTDVQMRLDIYRNELIVSAAESPFNIIIEPQKFDSAQLHGHNWRYLSQLRNPDNSNGAYCIILHNGPIKLYQRPKAALRERKQEGKIIYRFEGSSNFFIEKQGALYPVDRVGQFYKLFPEQKKQIRAFIRDRHYKFKKNPSETMVEILKNLPLE